MKQKLTLLILVLFTTMGAWAEVTTQSFVNTETTSITSGWYQIKWIDINNDTNTNYADGDVSGKFVTNYAQDVSIGSNYYSLYINTAPSTANEHALTFVYYDKDADTGNNNGSYGKLRSANGRYINHGGVSSLVASNNQYIIFRSSGDATKAVITSSKSGTGRTSLVPMGKNATPYIGQTATDKFPAVYFSPVNLGDWGLQAWTVSIVGLSDALAPDNTQVTYNGTGVYGLKSVYNNGTFFIDADVTPTESDLSIPSTHGLSYDVEINTTTHTITVTYEVKGATYTFDVSNGSFYRNLSVNKSAAEDSNSNLCNCWISKAIADVPQLKLITSDASGSAGNNIRTIGKIFTKDTPSSTYSYKLKLSGGAISSYTIKGTAVDALSINGEAFAASASVNKKVNLDTPANEVTFSLSGSSGWLSISQIDIEYVPTSTKITELAGITSDGIYMISSKNYPERGVLYVGASYLDACGGYKSSSTYPANPSTEINSSNTNQQFAIYTYNNKTYLYNIGQGKFVGPNEDVYATMIYMPVSEWTITRPSSGVFKMTSNSKNIVINAWVKDGGKTYGTTVEAVSDGSEQLTITRVGTLTDAQKSTIENVISTYNTTLEKLTYLEARTIGSNLGQYSNARFASNDAKTTFITNMRNGIATATLSDLNNIISTVDATSFNQPAGHFVKFYSVAQSKYMGIAASGKQPIVSDAANAGLYFVTAENNIVSYKYGQYLKNEAGIPLAAVGGSAGAFTFTESDVIGKYNVNCGGYLVGWTSTSTDRLSELTTDDNKEKGRWEIEAVDALPITFAEFDDHGFASFFTPVAISTLPSGVKAYTASIDGGRVKFTRIDDIPANTGVILYQPEYSSDPVNLTIGSASTVIDSNVLKGIVAKTPLATVKTNFEATEILTMQVVDEDLGFYKFNGENLNGFKAFVRSNDVAGVKSFVLDFDDNDADAISLIKALTESEGVIYNLSGQRLQKTQKGINIVNGKKILK